MRLTAIPSCLLNTLRLEKCSFSVMQPTSRPNPLRRPSSSSGRHHSRVAVPVETLRVHIVAVLAQRPSLRCRLACHDVTMIAAFSITPLGVGTSVSEPVAEAVRLVRASGLPNETNAMFTNVEGDWDEVMDLIKACVMTVAAAAPRVSVVIKIDHRAGVTDGLHTKIDAIEQHLRSS